jgi:hypothetical protein
MRKPQDNQGMFLAFPPHSWCRLSPKSRLWLETLEFRSWLDEVHPNNRRTVTKSNARKQTNSLHSHDRRRRLDHGLKFQWLCDCICNHSTQHRRLMGWGQYFVIATGSRRICSHYETRRKTCGRSTFHRCIVPSTWSLSNSSILSSSGLLRGLQE